MDRKTQTLAELVRTFTFPASKDARGALWPFEFSEMPLSPVRAFAIVAPAGAIRGGHAHVTGAQLLICMSGCIALDLQLGEERRTVELNAVGDAVWVASPVWARQRYLTDNAMLLVFADTPYDPNSYVEGE